MTRQVTLGFVLGLLLSTAIGSTASAQFVLHDQNGPNLFVRGTQAKDTILLWESSRDEVMVMVNGKLTNVTEKTGIRASEFHLVGIVSYAGGDDINHASMPRLADKIITNGKKAVASEPTPSGTTTTTASESPAPAPVQPGSLVAPTPLNQQQQPEPNAPSVRRRTP